MKKRLDILVFEKGFTDSREKAKAVIMSGQVYVDNQKADKCGISYDENVKIEVRGNMQKYVSRGGLKLEKAIQNFDLDLKDKTAMDIGASTGGFTDCMLQNGAKKVYSIDVGYGQLAWKLRNDERVVNLERTNMRKVTNEHADLWLKMLRPSALLNRSLKQAEEKSEKKVLYVTRQYILKSLKIFIIFALKTVLIYLTLIFHLLKDLKVILNILFICKKARIPKYILP